MRFFMDKVRLTERQKDILAFIKGAILSEGYPPSLREICARFAIKGPNNARKHLDALERKGFIRRKRGRARGIEVIDSHTARGRRGISIPIAGAVRAGPPELAVEDIVGHVTLDEDFFNCTGTFILRVEGDSMIGAGMEEGDHLIVRPGPACEAGDIVVAMLGGEATVKRFQMEGGSVTLKPENPSMKPIVIDPGDAESFSIIGKVIFVMKKVG
ncbi:MAG: transcriptional repressor LexA, partial [Thermodesulfobacteriota bacterium]